MIAESVSPDSFNGVFAVSYGNAQSIDLKILTEPPIAIFKFAANWSRDGRKVERVTNGHYIVIAPERFTQIGHIPHESEPCDDIRYHAFFFHIEKRSERTDTIGFAEHLLPKGSRNYRLEGNSLFDSSDMGPLFIEAAPALVAQTSIPWARIGEEREDGWRGKNFRPRDTEIEQVVSGRQGRFFLRVYDSTKLVDSGEFRYARDLSEILVNNESFLPITGDPTRTRRARNHDSHPCRARRFVAPPSACVGIAPRNRAWQYRGRQSAR